MSGLSVGGFVVYQPFLVSAETSCPLDRTVVRADDLLYLTFRFLNFRCLNSDQDRQQIIRDDTSNPAYVLVEFPAQHLAEEVIEGSSIDAEGHFPDRKLLDARLSGPTVLAFRVAHNQPIPYTLQGLLGEITRLPLQTTIPLSPDNFDVLNQASEFNKYYAQYFDVQTPVTRIEIPFRMILSPEGDVTVCHDNQPRVLDQSQRVPVWHTFVRTRIQEEACNSKATNLILLPLATRGLCSPFQGPLSPTADAKRQVVGLAHSTGRRVQAERLILSALGGSLFSKFNVPRTNVEELSSRNYDLTAWEQQTSWGRDQYVREVHAGFLYPYGHRASYEIITKRIVRSIAGASSSDTVAFLEREHFITVLKEDLEMDKPGQSTAGNQIAFKQILLKDKKSAPLDDPLKVGNVVLGASVPLPPNARDASCASSPNTGTATTEVPKAFWLREARSLRPVTMSAFVIDHAGLTPELPAPLIFYSVRVTKKEEYDVIKKAYEEANNVDMRSQRLAYAPSVGPRASETTILSTASLRLTTTERTTAFTDAEKGLDRAPFQPIIKLAEVKLDSVNQMFAQERTTFISYAEPYIDSAFSSKNKGCVFAKIMNVNACEPPGIDFKNLGDRSMGLATPDMRFAGLSALTGPIAADLEKLAADGKDALKQFSIGKIDLKSIFSDATIFGQIKLSEILDGIEGSLPDPGVIDSSLPKVPGLITRVEGTPPNATAVTEFSWHTTKLVSNSLFEPLPNSALSIKAVTRTPISRSGVMSKPTVTVESELKNFTLHLIPNFRMIDLKFKSITFRTETGKSPHVRPDIESISFGKELEFVQAIARATSGPAGTSKLPSIEIGPALIGARFMFPIPDLTMGAFTLMNLRVGIGLKIPLDSGYIKLTLQLGERMNPFTVAVGIFGGGGYFFIELSAKGLEGLAIAIEFGAMAALSFGGLASGKAEIKAGIYYYQEGDKCVLAAYIRAAGTLNVLGLISVSLIYYLELRYQKEGDSSALYGRATITVEIKLLFFSKSVDLTLERRLAGSESTRGSNSVSTDRLIASVGAPYGVFDNAAPARFSQLLPLTDWLEYTSAFGR